MHHLEGAATDRVSDPVAVAVALRFAGVPVERYVKSPVARSAHASNVRGTVWPFTTDRVRDKADDPNLRCSTGFSVIGPTAVAPAY